MRYRHLILDRDGVLNAEAPGHGYITSPDQWRWIPGALEAIVMLCRAGVHLSVATNQSAIGRGLMTPADLEAVHTRMRTDVKLAGGWIDAVYACPHAPDARCECRKPAPGLIQQAIVNSGVRAEETLVVGDDGRDLDAARAAGVDAALVMTGKGLRTAASLPAGAPPVYDDLRTLALHLLVEGRAKGEPIQ